MILALSIYNFLHYLFWRFFEQQQHWSGVSQGIARSQRGSRRQTMPYSAATLIIRSLHDVFGEIDPARRRAAIDELYNEDGVFYDPNSGAHRGRDEIDRVAGVIKATHPDFQYKPIGQPEELGDAARVRWVSGPPGKPPAYAGTDFLIARNGKIAAVYLFFDGHGDATASKQVFNKPTLGKERP
jgi:hypothetical protein